MTDFAEDTFTDSDGTLLTSHVGELGATWTVQPSVFTGSAQISNANRLRPTAGADLRRFYSSGVPPAADYEVSANIVWLSGAVGFGYMGVCGRMSTSADTSYTVRWAASLTAWQLFKMVAGTQTQLGSNVVQALTAGRPYRVKLRMVGTRISVSVEGVDIIVQTDAVITAAGRGGVWVGQNNGGGDLNTTGVHLDAFTAEPFGDASGILRGGKGSAW